MRRLNIIKEADFRKQIKSAPATGYLFFGEEDYMKAAAMKLARDSVKSVSPAMATFDDIRLDGLDFTPAALLDAMTVPPMGADRKVISVTGLNLSTLRAADLDKLYGDNFKPYVYDAPSDDAIDIGKLGGHGGPAYLYAVDVNDMFPGGMVGEWCMMTGGVFIPKSMLSDINMAEGNTVGSPGHRVDPVFSFAGGTGEGFFYHGLGSPSVNSRISRLFWSG